MKAESFKMLWKRLTPINLANSMSNKLGGHGQENVSGFYEGLKTVPK